MLTELTRSFPDQIPLFDAKLLRCLDSYVGRNMDDGLATLQF
jgi:hypothetical protein